VDVLPVGLVGAGAGEEGYGALAVVVVDEDVHGDAGAGVLAALADAVAVLVGVAGGDDFGDHLNRRSLDAEVILHIGRFHVPRSHQPVRNPRLALVDHVHTLMAGVLASVQNLSRALRTRLAIWPCERRPVGDTSMTPSMISAR
jgi:hypothetical protein